MKETTVLQQRNRRTKGGLYACEIKKEEVLSLLHLPSSEACRRLGIGLTVLKKVCRNFGIKRWPYRGKFGGSAAQANRGALATPPRPSSMATAMGYSLPAVALSMQPVQQRPGKDWQHPLCPATPSCCSASSCKLSLPANDAAHCSMGAGGPMLVSSPQVGISQPAPRWPSSAACTPMTSPATSSQDAGPHPAGETVHSWQGAAPAWPQLAAPALPQLPMQLSLVSPFHLSTMVAASQQQQQQQQQHLPLPLDKTLSRRTSLPSTPSCWDSQLIARRNSAPGGQGTDLADLLQQWADDDLALPQLPLPPAEGSCTSPSAMPPPPEVAAAPPAACDAAAVGSGSPQQLGRATTLAWASSLVAGSSLDSLGDLELLPLPPGGSSCDFLMLDGPLCNLPSLLYELGDLDDLLLLP